MILTRSYETEMEVTGLNLSGLAYRYNQPSMVNDHNGTPSYLEAISQNAANKSLKERGRIPVPVGDMHPWVPGHEDLPQEPIGFATFHPGTDGLEFDVRLNPERADEVVARVQDGSRREVSLSYIPHKSIPKGAVTLRTEIEVFELSLVDRAAHRGAEVMAVRSSDTPRLEEMKRLAVLL